MKNKTNLSGGDVDTASLVVGLPSHADALPAQNNILPCAESASGDAGRRQIRVECVHSSARGCDFPVPVLAEQLNAIDSAGASRPDVNSEAREKQTNNERDSVHDSRGREKPSKKKEARLAERKSLTKRDRPRGGVILSGIRERGWQLISDFEMEVAYSYFWKVKRNRTPPMAGTGGVMGGDPFDDEFGSMLGNYRKPNLGNAS